MKLRAQKLEIIMISFVVPLNLVFNSRDVIFAIKRERPMRKKEVERFSAEVLAWKKGRNQSRLNAKA